MTKYDVLVKHVIYTDHARDHVGLAARVYACSRVCSPSRPESSLAGRV